MLNPLPPDELLDIIKEIEAACSKAGQSGNTHVTIDLSKALHLCERARTQLNSLNIPEGFEWHLKQVSQSTEAN